MVMWSEYHDVEFCKDNCSGPARNSMARDRAAPHERVDRKAAAWLCIGWTVKPSRSFPETS